MMSDAEKSDTATETSAPESGTKVKAKKTKAKKAAPKAKAKKAVKAEKAPAKKAKRVATKETAPKKKKATRTPAAKEAPKKKATRTKTSSAPKGYGIKVLTVDEMNAKARAALNKADSIEEKMASLKTEFESQLEILATELANSGGSRSFIHASRGKTTIMCRGYWFWRKKPSGVSKPAKTTKKKAKRT